MLVPSDKSLGYCRPPFGLAARDHATQNSEEPKLFICLKSLLATRSQRLYTIPTDASRNHKQKPV